MVGVPMPSRSPLVTRRSRYRASSGVAWASSPASRSSLRPCDPGPCAAAIWCSVSTTAVTVKLAAGGSRRGQQLLGGQAEIAGRPDQGGDLRGAGAGGGGHRADSELFGQAQVHPGELRRDQALAQVADHRQQPGRRPGQQHGQPIHQRQPPTGPFQVTVGLGDGQVLHGSLLRPIMTRRVPAPRNRSAREQRADQILTVTERLPSSRRPGPSGALCSRTRPLNRRQDPSAVDKRATPTW